MILVAGLESTVRTNGFGTSSTTSEPGRNAPW